MKPIDPHSETQPIHLHGDSWDPHSQLTHAVKTQPIHLHGGTGDPCSQSRLHSKSMKILEWWCGQCP